MNRKEQLFTEVIKVKNGKFINPQPHVERIFDTTAHFFSQPLSVDLNNCAIPNDLQSADLVKCRIVYNQKIVSIEFTSYIMPQIKSLSIVEHNAIDYSYKYHNRELINKLKATHNTTDDILIIKNSQVTDTSFSNVVFKDYEGKLYTPKTYLLAGTKRQQLLNKGVIKEKEIKTSDIKSYMGAYLINAMIDIKDNVFVAIDAIF